MSETRRPNVRNFFSNWGRYEGSVAEKLRLTAKNQWRKARSMRSCCGNHGEPGC